MPILRCDTKDVPRRLRVEHNSQRKILRIHK